MSNTYDYVVIGAGSAGCAVAGRLAEDSAATVLLVEAGGSNRRLEVKAPLAFSKQFHTKLDWDYWTEPEPHLAGRRIYSPRGKMLGGSSSTSRYPLRLGIARSVGMLAPQPSSTWIRVQWIRSIEYARLIRKLNRCPARNGVW